MVTGERDKSVRNLEVVYGAQLTGVFIQDIYGNLYTKDEWDGTQTANGVAVITPECEFVITPYISSGNLYVTDVYSLSDVSLSSLTEEQALSDFNGQSNTDALYTVLTDGLIGTFKRSYSKQGGNIYLHSAGEAYLFANNFSEIKSCLEIISSFTSTSLKLITSSRADENSLWCISCDSNVDVSITKESPYERYNVWGLTEYHTSDDIKSFQLYDYFRGTYQYLSGITWRQFVASEWNIIAGEANSLDVLFSIDESNNRVIAGTRNVNDGTKPVTPDDIISNEWYSAGPL